jgi:hypothetical protein
LSAGGARLVVALAPGEGIQVFLERAASVFSATMFQDRERLGDKITQVDRQPSTGRHSRRGHAVVRFELVKWTADRGFTAVDPKPEMASWTKPIVGPSTDEAPKPGIDARESAVRLTIVSFTKRGLPFFFEKSRSMGRDSLDRAVHRGNVCAQGRN